MSAKLLILPFLGLSRCALDARVAPPGVKRSSAGFPILPSFVFLSVLCVLKGFVWLKVLIFLWLKVLIVSDHCHQC